MVLAAGTGKGGRGEAKEQGGEKRARGGGRRCGSRRGKGWLRASQPPQLRPGPGLRLRVQWRRRRGREEAAEEEEEEGCAARPRAALVVVRGARSGRRGAARAERGAGTARGVEERSRAAPLGPLPPPSSARACALRVPQPLMSCGARGAAGLWRRAGGGRGRRSTYPEPAPRPGRTASPCLNRAPNRFLATSSAPL